jgi:hypothetical protein
MMRGTEHHHVSAPSTNRGEYARAEDWTLIVVFNDNGLQHTNGGINLKAVIFAQRTGIHWHFKLFDLLAGELVLLLVEIDDLTHSVQRLSVFIQRVRCSDAGDSLGSSMHARRNANP